MAAADAVQKESLRTRRLVLTPVAVRHARALHALINDWEVVKTLAVLPWPVPLAAVESFAASQERSEGGEDAFAVLLDGAPIGTCGIKRPGSGRPPRKMPRLGYWIGRPHWGQGYATEAVAAIVGHAFERFDADVVGAGVFVDNPASRRVLEKLGFTRVGGYPVGCAARGERVVVDNMHVTRARWAERAKAA
jgi:RimJ/RimL family protein N-acetyltransferase